MLINNASQYFDKIERYNRDIVAYKRTFFQNVSVEDLKKLINYLSYNTDFNSFNYHWGKRYLHEPEGKLTWVTSTDKMIKAYYYSKDSHQIESYQKKAFLTNDMIKAHFLSCYGNNRKMGFFYKLEGRDKKDLENYPKSLENLYKISNKTFGLSQSTNTDILLIDIDNREERPALLTLKKLLNHLQITIKDLVMLEHNPFTGGLHTAIKLPRVISRYDWYRHFMNYLNSQDIVVECDFINNILRLPLSYEYVAIKKDNEIFEYTDLIPQHLWEESFISFITNLSDKICPSEILYNNIKEFNSPKMEKDKWENYWKIRKVLFNRPDAKKSINVYDFKAGERWETEKRVIPFLKGLGYGLSDIVSLIMEHNKSSKDLAKWGASRYLKEIKPFYDKCNVIIDWKSDFSNDFISNLDKIPQRTLDFLNSSEFIQLITKRFIENYIKERNKHNMSLKSLSKDKQAILDRQIPYFVKEIIGAMYFHINDNKETLVKERIGFQLSNTFMERLQEHCIKELKMDKNNPLVKTSMQYLKSALIKTLSLKEIKYKSRKRNWMLGSCKSYEINCLNDINELLKHFANILYNNWINLNRIISINDFPILYILLGGKQGFLKNCKKFENSA